MLDLQRMQRIELVPRPIGQRIVASLLSFDYAFPRRTEIVVEGVERIPQDRAVFLAMNHTDRYNYWPFQYTMYRRGLRFTATWVKGKYYEHPLIAKFMDLTGNIPLPSRGYVVATAFKAAHGRPPSEEEYRVLRDLVDERAVDDVPAAVDELFSRAGGREAWAEAERQRFSEMMDEVMRITRQGMDRGLHILVFPEGTRSIRLSRGRTGMMQAAQHLGAAIVPIGCNGSHRVYPANSPSAKGGRIVYRVGEVLEIDGPELAPHRIEAPFVPFTVAASRDHGQAFQAATDVVMERIDGLLDPEHRHVDGDSALVKGVDRFV
jgi:1-acyl-sn-glycerol-3-phosphate acyltransferase